MEMLVTSVEDGSQVLLVGMESAGEKVKWAQEHDEEMQEMVRNANRWAKTW